MLKVIDETNNKRLISSANLTEILPLAIGLSRFTGCKTSLFRSIISFII